MMRTVTVICALAFFLHCALCDLNAARAKCIKELDFKGDPTKIQIEGAPKEDKCFISCVLEKRGALKKDGSYDVEASKASIASTKEFPDAVKEKMYKIIEECAKEVKAEGDDLCEIGYKYFQCKKGKMTKKD